MATIKSDHQLSASQVTTPKDVVALFWRLFRERRESIGTVLDLGAGDGRFAISGKFKSYIGIEIDRNRIRDAMIPKNAKLLEGCAFKQSDGDFDACIGNPPYVRHHSIEKRWKKWTLDRLGKSLGIKLDQRFNLYLYFMCLGLLRTSSDGLLAVIVPHEWFGRPSSRPLRDYINSKSWNVDIYRFTRPIFDGVMTTASITFIDKSTNGRRWQHFDISEDLNTARITKTSSTRLRILPYENRGSIWAERGLSPGTQRIFTLTEGERIHNGLQRDDVLPCVTSLACIPSTVATLTKSTFKKHFIDAGQKCWLIKSYLPKLSRRLVEYLASIPENERATWTCKSREPWYRFRLPRTAEILVSSGFVEFGPKVMVNEIGAIAVGTVYGVYGAMKSVRRGLRDHLASVRFERQVIPHANTLKKIEVRQLNSVLNRYFEEHARDV